SLLLAGGCDTTGSSEGSGPSASKMGDAAPLVLTKGMTKYQVLELLGEPTKINEIYQDEAVAQVWTYEKELVEGSTIEPDGEQERVYADPETGEFVKVVEPIYRNVTIKSFVVTELLFNADTLIAFKEDVQKGGLEVGHR